MDSRYECEASLAACLSKMKPDMVRWFRMAWDEYRHRMRCGVSGRGEWPWPWWIAHQRKECRRLAGLLRLAGLGEMVHETIAANRVS